MVTAVSASCRQVLELLKRRGQGSEENFDAMGLLQTLCLVKMDSVDGKAAERKQAPAKPRASEPARRSSAPKAGAAEMMDDGSDGDKQDKVETEMKGEGGHRNETLRSG